ncbi:hypothetical protein GF358_01650 [Candidatus Woesearchaeota archaeon]|nr:hypothetical protein [Candidatus Woesearchaeota archaeon]
MVKELKKAISGFKVKVVLLMAMLAAIMAGCKSQEFRLPKPRVKLSASEKEQVNEFVEFLSHTDKATLTEFEREINILHGILSEITNICDKKEVHAEDIIEADRLLTDARKKWGTLAKKYRGADPLTWALHTLINLKQEVLDLRLTNDLLKNAQAQVQQIQAEIKQGGPIPAGYHTHLALIKETLRDKEKFASNPLLRAAIKAEIETIDYLMELLKARTK